MTWGRTRASQPLCLQLKLVVTAACLLSSHQNSSILVYSRLVEVIRKNELSNVECFNMGCGTGPRTEMLMVPVSSGNATIRREGVTLHGPVKEVSIKIDSLDHVALPLVSRLDFLKIDTEGFEDQVLLGAEKLISRFQPVIYIELSQEYSESSRRAITWLREHGYVFETEPDLADAHNGDNFIAFPAGRDCGQ